MTPADGPRVIVEDAPRKPNRGAAFGPAVFASESSERVLPVQRAVLKAAEPKIRRWDRWVRAGLWAFGLGIASWAVIDAYEWVVDAFARGATLGGLALATITAVFGGAALVIGRELKSFLALRKVEHDQDLLSDAGRLRSGEMRAAVRRALAVVPKDPQIQAAIEAYQRQSQAHHTPAQQVQLLSRTVMRPLDMRARAAVRRSTGRAFALTAIAPTALIDTVLFAAMSVHMLRGIAACYGHRPTAAATAHLVRRLIFEAGKLAAIDLAGMTIAQHVSGAVAERLAADSVHSLYAAQRMARIGLLAMAMCRPVPFQEGEAPNMLSALLESVLARADSR
jgi:putative membrane protein